MTTVTASPSVMQRLRARPFLRGLVLVGPAATWLFLFLAVPLVLVLVYSFWTYRPGGIMEHTFTLEDYARFLSQPVYGRILWRSFSVGLQTTVLALLLSYPTAYYLARRSSESHLLIFLILVPFWTSYLIRIFSWMLILMERGVLRAIKKSVDRNRKPGQYLLTGSANILTLSTVSEALAGRVALNTLYPFCWPEYLEKPKPTILNDLFKVSSSKDLLRLLPKGSGKNVQEQITQRILTGGYPTPSLMDSGQAQKQWFASYRQTYLERDLLNIKSIENIPDFNRLLSLVAFRTGGLLNLSDLSRETGLPFTNAPPVHEPADRGPEIIRRADPVRCPVVRRAGRLGPEDRHMNIV